MKQVFLKLFLFLILLSNSVSAQLVTTTGAPLSAIQGALSGDGISVSNVQIRCDPTQYATFNSIGSAVIGINKGLLLTTGTAINIGSGANTFLSRNVPLGVNPVGFSSVDVQFPVLDAIIPVSSSINDACEVSFELVPNCNLINLKYVFASDEYPTYSASTCPPVSNNLFDIFAFIISGPNPLGGSYSNQNLALVPSTSMPVTIHSVSPFCNSGLYTDNQFGSSLAYDGFTKVFTAAVAVVPCQTYTMKLQIADGGDPLFDSGVFIEYQSFACASSVINTSANTTICPLQATTITAANVSSYSWNTSPVTSITYINDSTIVISPAVTTTVTVSGFDGCSIATQTLSTKKIIITVNPPTDINFDATYTQASTCGNNNGRFRVSSLANAIVGGTAPYVFDFNNSGVFTSNKTLSGLFGGTYTVTVKDSKECSFSENFIINAFSGITTYSSIIDSATCNLNNGKVVINSVIGGTAPYTYTFNNGVITTVNSISSLYGNNKFAINIKDVYGCTLDDTIKIKNFSGPEKIYLSVFKDTCGLNKGKVVIDSVKLGNLPYTYFFGNTLGTTATSMSNLPANPQFIVKVTDAYNCSRQDTVKIDKILPPIVDAGQDTTICVGEEISLKASITQGANTISWQTNGLGLIENPNLLITKYTPTNLEQKGSVVQFTLKSVDHFPACLQAVAIKNITIEPNPIASFTSDSIKMCIPFYAKINNLSSSNAKNFKWYLDSTLLDTTFVFNKEFTAVGNHAISLVGTSAIGCKDSLIVYRKVIAIKQPISLFDLETTTPIENELTTFSNNSTNADRYKWDFGDNSPISEEQIGQHVYSVADEYKVSLIANDQTEFCSDTSYLSIIVNSSTRIFIPKTFTPNNDGLNDFYEIKITGINPNPGSFELSIFDRWGKRVHYATDYANHKWDGNGVEYTNALVIKLKVQDKQGNIYHYEETITLLK